MRKLFSSNGKERYDRVDDMEWDPEEFKRLKKKKLVHYNIIFAILLVIFYYLAEQTTDFAFVTIVSVCLWFNCLISLYSFFSGRKLGTKTSRLVQEFEKSYQGEKKWRRKRVISVIFETVLPAAFTIFLIFMDFSNQNQLDGLVLTGSLIASLIVVNVSELFRIGLLNEEESDASE